MIRDGNYYHLPWNEIDDSKPNDICPAGTFPDNTAETLPCSGRGRYVILQAYVYAILTLCEVEVFGYGNKFNCYIFVTSI